jgi:hypothetical protein
MTEAVVGLGTSLMRNLGTAKARGLVHQEYLGALLALPKQPKGLWR